MRRHEAFLIGIAFLLISGCASQPYRFQEQVQAGDLSGAEQTLEDLYTSKKNIVLHNLYDATLQQLKGDFESSNRILEETKPLADELALISISETTAASTISESLQSFSGSQFERLMIYCLKFLNYMAQGDYNSARIETEQAELKLREWGRSLTDFPFIPFLNALAYEAQGLTDNALVSYRRSLEAYEGYAPRLVKQSYLNLLAKDGRANELLSQENALNMKAQYSPQKPASLLVFITDGTVSARVAGIINHRLDNRVDIYSIAVPFYPDSYQPVPPPQLYWNQSSATSQIVINTESEMRDALDKQMPGFIARGVARAITREQVRQRSNDEWSFLFEIAGTITELATADTRSWDILPQAIFVARVELPPTEISFQTSVSGIATTSLFHQADLQPGLNFFLIQAR